MYRKGWRYYRDSILLWLLFFSMIAACAYALEHPLFWSAAVLFWMIRSPFRYAFSFAHPFRQINWMRETRLEFREVELASRDGLTLFGRFAPGRNHGAIILIHGLGGVGAGGKIRDGDAGFIGISQPGAGAEPWLFLGPRRAYKQESCYETQRKPLCFCPTLHTNLL